MRDFDITGFVHFPNPLRQDIKMIESGKTYIYLVAIDYESNDFSKIILRSSGDYIGDDVSPKKNLDTSKMTINEIVNIMKSESSLEINKYFVSSVLVGWSLYSYQSKDNIQPWYCTFKDLTGEGKRLYYSFKKLHYDKDVRLLTFNNINQ
jgi:hypothetical protein